MPPRKKGRKSTGSKPVDPVNPAPVDPVNPEPIDPVEPEPVDLVKEVKPETGDVKMGDLNKEVKEKENKGDLNDNLNEEIKGEENKVDLKNKLNEEIEDKMEEDEEEVEYEEIEVDEEEDEEVERENEERESNVERENDEERENEEESEEEEEEEEEESEKGMEVERENNEERENKEERENDEEREKHAKLLARPPQGCEIYIGNIPLNCTEEDLKAFCEPHGDIFEVRMMKDNRGFAFVTYKKVEMALKAIENLHNSDFKGKKLRCSASQSKNRIFIGNVPRKWEENDLKNAVNKVGPGVIRVDLMMDNVTGRSRGFGFVEYYNHACADYSLKILSKTNFKFENNAINVSWADPRGGTSESSPKAQIKAVYVKNLPKDVSENKLRDLFEKHGEIEKVVLPPLKAGHDKKYAFIHFKNRADALKAIQDTEKYQIDGEVVECSLAKPPSAEKRFEPANQRPPPIMSHYQSRSGPSMMGYNSVPPAYMPPPMMAPPGMSMMPMMLPDGRLGYVLQQPGVAPVPPRGGNMNNNYNNNYNYNNNNNRGGGSGRGKRGYNGNNRGGGPVKRFRN